MKTDTKEENKVRRIYDMVKGKYQQIKKILTDQDNQNGVRSILKEVRYLLRHYAPSKVKAEASFSAGDPALTGQVLGLASLIPAVYCYDIHLYPDFQREEIYAQGELKINGHARVLHIVRSGIHLFKDRSIRKIMKNRKSR